MKRVLLAALLVLAACTSDASSGPQPGSLKVTLTAGGAADGAVVLVISGGPVASVDTPAGYQIASNADGEGTHVMVMGTIVAGTIATINVPDISRASAYVATVVQASDRNTFALLDPVRYKVTVAP